MSKLFFRKTLKPSLSGLYGLCLLLQWYFKSQIFNEAKHRLALGGQREPYKKEITDKNKLCNFTCLGSWQSAHSKTNYNIILLFGEGYSK